MDNTIIQAKRQTMPGPGAQAAQASLKHQVKGSKVSGLPVGNMDKVIKPQPTNIPTGGPTQLPPQPEFDPGIFKQDMADSIVGQIRTNDFLNSAAAKDAMTSVQLKEFFNQFNPNKKPDPRSLVDRVVNRMGLNPNEER
jgi:hypothetical protein